MIYYEKALNRIFKPIVMSLTLVAISYLAACSSATVGDENASVERNYTYPSARMSSTVDDFHGTKVPDPYDWMSDHENEEVIAWVDAQNALTRKFIDSSSSKEKLKTRYSELYDYTKYSAPSKIGGRYFYRKNEGLQNQSVIYVQESLDGESRIVLDPNKLSEDGTVSISPTQYSPDGKYLAYGASKSGSDWKEIFIRNIDSGENFEEVLKHSKFSGIAWDTKSQGFYYNRFPDPSTVEPGQESYNSKVYYHKLGTSQSEDPLVYERTDKPEYGFWPFSTDDGKYLMLWVSHGAASNNRIYYREMDSDGDFIRLLDEADAEYYPVGTIGTQLYLQTNKDATRRKIISIDLTNPAPEQWKTVIPEGDDVIARSVLVNDHFVVSYMHDAHYLIKMYNLEGNLIKTFELPVIGSVNLIDAHQFDKEFFLTFESFLYPSSIYRYDFNTDSLELFRKPEIDFDFGMYVTKQVFVTSKDSTQVPLFITHKKDIVLDGNNPTLLYAYGGFNVSITPRFSTSRLMWLENGGVYASAVLRGGGEYGEEWHEAGKLGNKQNVFDDFIASGKWLIDNGYTNSSRLAIEGASNGGLLVAATMLQQPKLFGAVVCRVPVTDMLRYHKWAAGRYWIGEYGNAEEDAEHFKYLYEYSPLHNVVRGETYPPILITTADTDDRVVPRHAKKFAATLQAADAGINPILLRVEKKAGHGAGKPTSKIIEEQSDIYAFLHKVFGME